MFANLHCQLKSTKWLSIWSADEWALCGIPLWEIPEGQLDQDRHGQAPIQTVNPHGTRKGEDSPIRQLPGQSMGGKRKENPEGVDQSP